ncbi:hypothetical protein RHGRI_031937 [Rhododendron griersonianum]|uniref:Pentatricopeptide repeat-containing protein n=1 Tax=Rhododendron griersonianum TaxID=479676 RepID=A0AAV6IC55_9ERIC|nr:hypothetical protein RHGRI_031937 [Rhododendron griersonianum]
MATHAKRLVVSTLTAGTRCFSTATATVVNKGKEESLLRNISALATTDGSGNVADTLYKWVKQGSNNVKTFDIIRCVNDLRETKKYQRALQLCELMEKVKNQMNNADQAVRIDLLGKIEGLASAEEYFNNLEESSKNLKTYGALLGWYCGEKMVDEATDLFERMKGLSFTSACNYNMMMSLYLSIGEPEKVSLLAKEMEEAKIAADTCTYNKLLRGFASLKDCDAADGVLERMGKDKVLPDWLTYAILASIYVEAGLIDKANAALQKLEDMENVRDCKAFDSLIELYSRMSDLSGVNPLLKLDDADSLDKCFSEWESGCPTYDVRICNVILESYLKRNMIKRGVAFYGNLEWSGAAPNLKTRVLVANYFTSRGKRHPSRPCPACQFFNEAGEGGGEVLRLIDKEKDDEEETAEEFRERDRRSVSNV